MSELFCGVLLVNKPYGMTSHDVVNKVRRIFNTKKVGHTGTLDPMATGVLPVLVGRAVKASEYLVSDSKTYLAKMKLGLTTDTEDTSGKVLETCTFLPEDSKVIECAKSFIGDYLQTPPMYSALKVKGKKLCDLAREGVTIEREARLVQVHSLDIKKCDDGEWEILTSVSKGTYIRTLISDIGKKLSCGGVMSSLERRVSGDFSIENCVTLEDLEKMTDEEKKNALLSVESLFVALCDVTLPDFYTTLMKNGAEIYLNRAKIHLDLQLGDRVRVYDACGNFFALGEVRNFDTGLAIKPIKFF
ncbi:MAG: tRNA pseudouridine(55) synthase TruB [Ruminococcaceae bacterium]|nr:tRNA pseudouridine(55) synthase TruB [Oscillospiraceae bacterium]